MGLFDIFKKKSNQNTAPKCSECFRPIAGYVWQLNNKPYCQECYNRKMAIVQQNAGQAPEEYDFEMTIEDVFLIKNHGVVVSGKITNGVIHRNDTVTINNAAYTVTLIDVIPNHVEYAKRGANVGLHLSTMNASLFKRGDAVTSKRVKDTAPKSNTFVCDICGKELPIKYRHKENVCAECYATETTPDAATAPNCSVSNTAKTSKDDYSEYEIILPKTLFKLYDISTDLPGDNVSQRWANVIIDKCERLCIEKNSITYSAHSIGHNTGRYTTYEPISFEQLESLIKQSNDSNATKYSGMSQINWKEYIKEKKAKRKESKYPILTFGKYNWYVLDKYEDGTMLLLSKCGIDTLPWNTEEKLIDWPDSTLCHWLNTDFIKKSFTEKEKQALLTFDDNTRVSLLNGDLVEKYLKDDGALTAQPNQYALSRGAFSYTYSSGRPDCKIHVGNGLAWLKDTYKGEKISLHTWARCIYWDGSICMYSFDFDKAIVRPLIKVDSQKLLTFHC